MQFDLEPACKLARTEISVPSVPIAAIRYGAHVPQKTHRGRRWFVAAALAGITCAAAAAVEVTHVTYTQKGGIVLDGTAKADWSATQAEADAAAQRNRLTLPAGLPPGTRLAALADYAPDTLALAYNLAGENRQDNHLLWVIVTRATGSIAPGDAQMKIRFPVGKGRFGSHWVTGNEQVYLDAPSTMTDAEISAMKSAMGAHDVR